MSDIQDRSYDLRSRGGLIFREEDHSYHNAAGEKYFSTTGLLGDFKNKFDADGMSKYKAIKDVLTTEQLKQLKTKAGHWQKVAGQFWPALMQREEFKDPLLEVQQKYLDSWAKSGEVASCAGSLEHGKRESHLDDTGFYEWNGIKYEQSDKCILDIDDFDQCIISEILLWNHEIKLGGLADLMIFDYGKIHVLDYKTNKAIVKIGFMNKKMKRFLDHIPDASFYHYALQLKIYQKMACDLTGLEPGECWLISTKNDNYGRKEDVFIQCDDLIVEVNLLFNNCLK